MTAIISVDDMSPEALVRRFGTLQQKLRHDLTHLEDCTFMTEHEWREFKLLWNRCKRLGLAKREREQAYPDVEMVNSMLVYLDDLVEALMNREKQLTREQLRELKTLVTRFKGDNDYTGLMDTIDAEIANLENGTEEVSDDPDMPEEDWVFLTAYTRH